MKRILTLFIIFISALTIAAQKEESAFKEISHEISKLSSQMKKGRVALFPFEALGFSDVNYGSYAADKISAALSKEGKLTLVEREKRPYPETEDNRWTKEKFN